jgi:hypothetical protein
LWRDMPGPSELDVDPRPLHPAGSSTAAAAVLDHIFGSSTATAGSAAGSSTALPGPSSAAACALQPQVPGPGEPIRCCFNLGDISAGSSTSSSFQPIAAVAPCGRPMTIGCECSTCRTRMLALQSPTWRKWVVGLFDWPSTYTTWSPLPPGIIDLRQDPGMSNAKACQHMFANAEWLMRMEDCVEWKVGFTQAIDIRYRTYRFGDANRTGDVFTHMALLATFDTVDAGLVAEVALIKILHSLGFTMFSRHFATKDSGGQLSKPSKDPHTPTIYLMLRAASRSDPRKDLPHPRHPAKRQKHHGIASRLQLDEEQIDRIASDRSADLD